MSRIINKIDRKAKIYKQICPKCKNERFVTYAQNWSIKVGICSGKCQKCTTKENAKVFFLKGFIPWNKGLKGYGKGHPPYVKMFGVSNPSWKGGITPVNTKIRNSIEYANWRKTIFARDNYKCVLCGKGGDLHAHHCKPFSLYKEYRFDISNGITLCKPCHLKSDSWGGRVYGIKI